MTLAPINRAWTQKPPEDEKGLVTFVGLEGLPIWRLLLGDVNEIIDIINAGGVEQNVATFAGLVAIDAEELLDGAKAWVRSVQRLFVLTTTSTAPDAANDTYASTISGRIWIGTSVTNSRYWMGQLNWYIDDAGNRENSGADAAHPIPESERRARWGPDPQGSGEYHLRYVSDLDFVHVRMQLGANSVVFVHGSTINGAGQTTLLSATADVVVAQAPTPGNVPWQVTATAVPVSWTSANLVSTSTTSRCRLTSGNVGTKFWVMLDLGAQTARMSDTCQAVTYTTAGVGIGDNYTYPTITAGDTFVVEKLTQIKTLVVEVRCSGPQTEYPTIVFESIKAGKRDGSFGKVHLNGRGTVVFDGCEIITSGALTTQGSDRVYLTGSAHHSGIAGGTVIGLKNSVYHGGFTLGNMVHNLPTALGSQGIDNWIVQSGGYTTQQPAQIGSLGVFDSPSRPAFTCSEPNVPVSFFHIGGAIGGPRLWGSGNANYAVWLAAGSRVTYPDGEGAGFTIVGGGLTDIAFPGPGHTAKTAVRPFDDAVGAYAPAANTTFANLLAAIGVGGFGGHIFDPVSDTYFGESGAYDSTL